MKVNLLTIPGHGGNPFIFALKIISRHHLIIKGKTDILSRQFK